MPDDEHKKSGAEIKIQLRQGNNSLAIIGNTAPVDLNISQTIHVHNGNINATDVSDVSKVHNPEEGKILVELVKRNDGWHWIVNGEEKWVLKRDGVVLTISKILFNQIGLGWIPHESFLNQLSRFNDWNTKTYFGEDGHECKMQKQLNLLRRNLGVEILFKKDKGVRFPENIVKSR